MSTWVGNVSGEKSLLAIVASGILAAFPERETIMTPQDGKEELDAALQPFRAEYGLTWTWRTDFLLFMDPAAGSDIAHVCVSFDSGYWKSYAHCRAEDREYFRNELIQQLHACGVTLRNLGRDELYALHASPVATTRLENRMQSHASLASNDLVSAHLVYPRRPKAAGGDGTLPLTMAKKAC